MYYSMDKDFSRFYFLMLFSFFDLFSYLQAEGRRFEPVNSHLIIKHLQRIICWCFFIWDIIWYMFFADPLTEIYFSPILNFKVIEAWRKREKSALLQNFYRIIITWMKFGGGENHQQV